MSILIHGEEMPKNCVVCKNYYYCELWSKLTVNKRCKERHPDCPIVEVKEPHGRLIDADALLKKAPELQEYLAVLATVVIEAEGRET